MEDYDSGSWESSPLAPQLRKFISFLDNLNTQNGVQNRVHFNVLLI